MALAWATLSVDLWATMTVDEWASMLIDAAAVTLGVAAQSHYVPVLAGQSGELVSGGCIYLAEQGGQ